jgi:siderophore synthetase component
MTPDAFSSEALTSQALLNCLIREVSGPEDQVRMRGSHAFVRLARSGILLRARQSRPSAGLGPRLSGTVCIRETGSWRGVGSAELAGLIAAELTAASGTANPEFAAQVASSQAAIAAIQGGLEPAEDRFLASEQSLLAGHRFHPAPKARQLDWLRYAPEAGARFPLRFLGVRAEVLAGSGDTSALDRLGGPVPPEGFRLLPAHPWQYQLLAQAPWFGAAMRAGLLADLGTGSRDVVPTSSVRTVYDPLTDVFCKFSLNVRLTNCVRKSAWYELAASVILTDLLTPVFDDMGAAVTLLGEPGYRTAALAAREAYEGLAVIVRDGVAGVSGTPLLAASLTEPAAGLFDRRSPDWLAGWWLAYVRLVAAPVLRVFFQHGIVLEPHLQNVLIGVDSGDWPVRVVFRDLEGVKLVTDRHAELLAALPAGVARGLRYDTRRGWDRVGYCLFVNHLAEIAAAIADRAPELELDLWRGARDELTVIAKELGWPPQLRAVLAGVPLPAKANLRLRWARGADREAEYVPVPSPFRNLEPGW